MKTWRLSFPFNKTVTSKLPLQNDQTYNDAHTKERNKDDAKQQRVSKCDNDLLWSKSFSKKFYYQKKL